MKKYVTGKENPCLSRGWIYRKSIGFVDTAGKGSHRRALKTFRTTGPHEQTSHQFRWWRYPWSSMWSKKIFADKKRLNFWKEDTVENNEMLLILLLVNTVLRMDARIYTPWFRWNVLENIWVSSKKKRRQAPLFIQSVKRDLSILLWGYPVRPARRPDRPCKHIYCPHCSVRISLCRISSSSQGKYRYSPSKIRAQRTRGA